MAQWTPQQLQQMAALLQGTHNNLAVDAALAGAPAQRWAVDAQGQRVDPYASNPTVAAIDQAAPTGQPAPQPMAFAPQSAQRPMPQPQAPQPSHVSNRMRFNPLFGTPVGSILSMFGGKQGAGGLMGLMGQSRAQQYAAANRGPGSVAEMERRHSGASRSPQSGGPAGGGEYASGGR